MAQPAAPDPAPVSGESARTSLAILALLAVSFMLYQIALLRELRFQLMTLFTLAPFLFSSVIACMACGSLYARRTGVRGEDVLRLSIVLLPLISLPLFALSMGIAKLVLRFGGASRFLYGAAPGTATESWQAYLGESVVAFVAVAVLGYGLIFFLQGLIFALYFRDGRQAGRLGNVYGADLIASGAGALAGGALAFVLTPVQTVVVATVLFAANVWVACRALRIRTAVAGAVTVVTLAMIGGELFGSVVSKLETPSYLGPVSSVWSRYRKIDARETATELFVYTDQLIFQAYRKGDVTHDSDPRRTEVALMRKPGGPAEDVLVIGAGSGADVQVIRDLRGPAPRITAVEIDEGFIRIARQYPWLWSSYGTADIRIQEGRYFLENDRKLYDLVLYSFIDPQSAVGSIGVPDANFLYTDAGIRAAYARVRDGGTLMIQRVYLVGEQEDFVRRLCATLQSAGISRESTRLYRRTWTLAWGYYGELSALHAIVRKGGGGPPEIQEPDLIPLDWIPGGRPTTDLFPFSLGTGVWFDALIGYVRHSGVLITVIGVALGTLLLSMATSAGRATFFVLGFGSFLLESMVLFNSFLLLGDPNLSAALAVGMFLLWGGVGSILSSRVEERRGFGAVVTLCVAMYVLTAPLLNGATIAAPVAVRCLAFAVHLAPVGMAAGMMFPSALRRFRDQPVPTLFTMDVIGCALAPPVFWIALSLTGVWLVMAGSVLCYAAVCVILALKSR